MNRNLCVPGQDVPLVWGGDDDVALGDQLEVGGRLSRQQDDLLAQRTELGGPVGVDNLCQVLERRHVNTSAFIKTIIQLFALPNLCGQISALVHV